jgi:SAM-dependent methyltransferase
MKDVPSPINLQDKSDARAWAEKAMLQRFYRSTFFKIISKKITTSGLPMPKVLELGSGPGFLIERVLKSGKPIHYEALDFSNAMHDLARERLGVVVDNVKFRLADFKRAGWQTGLGKYDFVVTMQAVHELRHKDYASTLFIDVQGLLAEGGILLYCDHHCGEGGIDNPELYMTPAEQESVLRTCFGNAALLHMEGSLALWESRKRI